MVICMDLCFELQRECQIDEDCIDSRESKRLL